MPNAAGGRESGWAGLRGRKIRDATVTDANLGGVTSAARFFSERRADACALHRLGA
jgi:hypothetical protein